MDSEVVNADSMQLYRGMDIGTAKVPAGERGHAAPPAGRARRRRTRDRGRLPARRPRAVEDILGRGRTPILVGGSGLYVQSVIDDIDFPATDPEVRAALERTGRGRRGRPARPPPAALDPAAAAAIEPANGAPDRPRTGGHRAHRTAVHGDAAAARFAPVRRGPAAPGPGPPSRWTVRSTTGCGRWSPRVSSTRSPRGAPRPASGRDRVARAGLRAAAPGAGRRPRRWTTPSRPPSPPPGGSSGASVPGSAATAGCWSWMPATSRSSTWPSMRCAWRRTGGPPRLRADVAIRATGVR